MVSRWTKDEELKLIKDIKSGKSFAKLSTKYNRSENALLLRFQKIVYENHNDGKSIKALATLFNLDKETIQDYFDSYSKFIETNDPVKKKDLNSLKQENIILKEIIDNIEYKAKIKRYTKDGLLSERMKDLI